MLRNRFLSIFAVAGLTALAACGGGDEGEATVEETTPAVDATAPATEPMPAPVTTDTMAMAPVDTTAGAATTPTTDTTVAPTTP